MKDRFIQIGDTQGFPDRRHNYCEATSFAALCHRGICCNDGSAGQSSASATAGHHISNSAFPRRTAPEGSIASASSRTGSAAFGSAPSHQDRRNSQPARLAPWAFKARGRPWRRLEHKRRGAAGNWCPSCGWSPVARVRRVKGKFFRRFTSELQACARDHGAGDVDKHEELA